MSDILHRSSRIATVVGVMCAVYLAFVQIASANTVYGPNSFGDTYLSDFGSDCLIAHGITSDCYRKAWSKTTLNPLVGSYTVYVVQHPMSYSWASCGQDCENFAWKYESSGSTAGSTAALVTQGRYDGNAYPGWTWHKCVVVPESLHSVSIGDYYYTSAAVSPRYCPQLVNY
jgi:hypothetical protein